MTRARAAAGSQRKRVSTPPPMSLRTRNKDPVVVGLATRVATVDIEPRSLISQRLDTPRVRKTATYYYSDDDESVVGADDFKDLEEELQNITILDTADISPPENSPCPPKRISHVTTANGRNVEPRKTSVRSEKQPYSHIVPKDSSPQEEVGDESIYSHVGDSELLVISWDDICPEGDKIEKIAEASYAEVYRITTTEGVSIIKAIRLKSPIKAQTATQKRSGLVDEEPHSEADLLGELRISEFLTDIPGFVVYKERYIVKGRAPRTLLETHQSFHRKAKRQDPDRLQFYPSPSRYLDDTKFLVIELGDAGTALEDFEMTTEEQMWDAFFLVAIALARAEVMVFFEHRDLHEGNLCFKQARKPQTRGPRDKHRFGFSGLDITILDYGLSRADDPDCEEGQEMAIACDLEQDLSLFTSTHADQCRVYRQMRSFLLRGERDWLPPERHNVPYEKGVEGPVCWDDYVPYSNVLWLAYLYNYMTVHFKGDKKVLAQFKKQTAELWQYMDPDAAPGKPCFGSAEDVVRFAVEAGWVLPDQLTGSETSFVERD